MNSILKRGIPAKKELRALRKNVKRKRIAAGHLKELRRRNKR